MEVAHTPEVYPVASEALLLGHITTTERKTMSAGKKAKDVRRENQARAPKMKGVLRGQPKQLRSNGQTRVAMRAATR
jgi:hypothetical protein